MGFNLFFSRDSAGSSSVSASENWPSPILAAGVDEEGGQSDGLVSEPSEVRLEPEEIRRLDSKLEPWEGSKASEGDIDIGVVGREDNGWFAALRIETGRVDEETRGMRVLTRLRRSLSIADGFQSLHFLLRMNC